MTERMSGKILYYPGYPALAFSDVYLYPAQSDVESRYGDQIDTSTTIARGLKPLNIPILTAGMDTVTGAQMAITIALQGGLGEVHRNNDPEEQANIVYEVKDRLRAIEENPPMVGEGATIADALTLLGEKRKRGYVIVHQGSEFTGPFLGLATPRDFKVGQPSDPLISVMTPRDQVKTVPQGTTLPEAVEFMKENRLEKVPVVDAEGNLVGMYSMKDHSLYEKYPNAALDDRGRLLVGAAIGVKDIDVERALRVVEAGADVLFLDIAHGHSIHSKRMMERLKKKEGINVPIVMGNVATPEGVIFAYNNGADAVKLGIGPGFACKTRTIAGVGVPQITAILEAREVLDKLSERIPLIADGGVRVPHDVQVAIAAGADAVMIGSVFAGTTDSPGNIIELDGKRMKLVRGMASTAVFNDRQRMGEITTDAVIYKAAAEGDEKLVSFKGGTREVIYEHVGGLRSGMSYVGAHTIPELQQARLIYVSSAGATEHGRALGG